jgi:Tfp pilus assembly protein FimT
MHAKSCRRNRGFSLIELTFGSLLIVTITMIAIPNVTRLRQVYRLAAASNDVQSQLHYARIQAISKNTDLRLRVTGPTTYVLERRFGGAWVVDRNLSLANGLSISATNTTEFHSRGNASPVATFTIMNPRTETRQVVVDTSGYIHAQ